MSDLLRDLAELERLTDPAYAAEIVARNGSLKDWAEGMKLDHILAFVERILIPISVFNKEAGAALRGIQQGRMVLRKSCPGLKTYPGESPGVKT